MSNTLLPCPFCGNDIAPKALDHNEIGNLGKGDFEYHANPYYSVVCRMNDDSPVPLASWQTGCGAAGGFRPTPEEAIAAWNRRADHLPDATKKVSNADRIWSMSDKELAEVSVYFTTRPDFDEGFDGEWYECGNIETWHSVFTTDLYDSPDDAINYVLEWLQRKEEHNEAD